MSIVYPAHPTEVSRFGAIRILEMVNPVRKRQLRPVVDHLISMFYLISVLSRFDGALCEFILGDAVGGTFTSALIQIHSIY